MASHDEVLERVAQLSVLNAELAHEVSSLEEGKDGLDQRFQTSISHLNQAIRKLPVVIQVLTLDNPPALGLPFASGLVLSLQPLSGEGTVPSTLDNAHGVMANIYKVDGDMRESQKEAIDKKQATADLASKAAEHIEHCIAIGRNVSDAQSQTQHSIDAANREIAGAQQEIDYNNRMSSEMASRARDHDDGAQGNNLIFWTTFWIPVVNFATIPISLALEAEHKKLAESCRQTAAKLDNEVKEKWTEKETLEATRRDLDAALDNLRRAESEAQDRANHASSLRDQARLLTDKYNVVTTRLRDVIRAMDHLNGEISAEDWDSVRGVALMTVKGMLGTLGEGGLLDDECLGVVKLVEELPGVEKGDYYGLLLGELEF